MEDLETWLTYVYGHGHWGPKPELAERLLRENPRFRAERPHAAGDLEGIMRTPAALDAMPPLVAVTHSSLSRVRPADFEACAEYLLKNGADPSGSTVSGGHALSALYGAAGKNHQPGLTKLLLEAGANPNDNESVYHAVESADLSCLRLLLAVGWLCELALVVETDEASGG